jgi:hypothetical protein
VAVKKHFPAKFAKIKSRQEALQATFSVFLDSFYPQIFGYFEENGLFQQLQAFTLPRRSRGNPFGINKPWQRAFIPMGGPQSHGNSKPRALAPMSEMAMLVRADCSTATKSVRAS